MSKSPLYLAYMLRLWQVDREGQSQWRASLESPHTAERLGFADVAQLLAFLQETTGVEPTGDENESSEQ